MTGRHFFEDLAIGQVLRHGISRTLTETDNLFSSFLIMSVEPLQLDTEFARNNSPTRERLFNSVFTLGVMIGVSTHEVSYDGSRDFGLLEVHFPNAARRGDTLSTETEVLSKMDYLSSPAVGIVRLTHSGYDQTRRLIGVATRDALVMKRHGTVVVHPVSEEEQ